MSNETLTNVGNRSLQILGLFVAAIVVRFGWEFGGWLIRRLF